MTDHPSGATAQVAEWLSTFASALERADFDAAAGMFLAESYWRDLVSFTWNIKTAEGQDEIRAMLKATVMVANPKNWQVVGEATIDKGVIQSWIMFETAVSRGEGHIRLKEGKCWTLLTTMAELKQFPEEGRRSTGQGCAAWCREKSEKLARN